MTSDERRDVYAQALNHWSVPPEDSAKNGTNTWFDWYFWRNFGIENLEELPELWELLEDKIFDLSGNYPGFNQIGREWRQKALERAIEQVEITI